MHEDVHWCPIPAEPSDPWTAAYWGAADFVPRSECGAWGAYWADVSQVADFVIAFAYFIIPGLLFLLFWKNRARITRMSAATVLLFAAFIFSCGLTHVFSGLAFDWPAYRTATVVKWVCAVLSLITLPSLYWQGKWSLQDLHQIIDQRDATIRNNKVLERELTIRVAQLTREHQLLERISSGESPKTEIQRQLSELLERARRI